VAATDMEDTFDSAGEVSQLWIFPPGFSRPSDVSARACCLSVAAPCAQESDAVHAVVSWQPGFLSDEVLRVGLSIAHVHSREAR
jgi:hypothetical protein